MVGRILNIVHFIGADSGKIKDNYCLFMKFPQHVGYNRGKKIKGNFFKKSRNWNNHMYTPKFLHFTEEKKPVIISQPYSMLCPPPQKKITCCEDEWQQMLIN